MTLLSMFPESIKDAVKRRIGVTEDKFRVENLKRIGFSPARIIDCGAYKGDWTLMMEGYFPEAEYLLIEPQTSMIELLEGLAARRKNWLYRRALLADVSDTKFFVEQESNSRIVKKEDIHLFKKDELREEKVTSLDELVSDTPFSQGADFLKIDAQGFEIEILKGASSILKSAKLVQLEVSVIQIGPCPSFYEVMQFMQEAGFQVYDIFGANYRPRDNALWQLDCIFVSNSSPLIESRSWS